MGGNREAVDDFFASAVNIPFFTQLQDQIDESRHPFRLGVRHG
jgi:hypothetical protein